MHNFRPESVSLLTVLVCPSKYCTEGFYLQFMTYMYLDLGTMFFNIFLLYICRYLLIVSFTTVV